MAATVFNCALEFAWAGEVTLTHDNASVTFTKWSSCKATLFEWANAAILDSTSAGSAKASLDSILKHLPPPQTAEAEDEHGEAAMRMLLALGEDHVQEIEKFAMEETTESAAATSCYKALLSKSWPAMLEFQQQGALTPHTFLRSFLEEYNAAVPSQFGYIAAHSYLCILATCSVPHACRAAFPSDSLILSSVEGI